VNLRSFSVLQLALGASITVHAVLLTVHFVDPESFNRVFEDTPLEVILVNARTTERPEKAIAIAQAAMAGGGDADLGRATSPLPPALISEIGDDVQQSVQSQLQRPPQPKQSKATPSQVAREEKRRQLIKLLAEIERRINQENARPKKRYISPATQEEVYAVYYDHLRRTIEDKGTENFPEAGGKKLYGELTMIVTVNFDGQVLNIEIVQSSGNRTLDRRAEAIARSAGPFGTFNAAMRRQADQILVVSRFKFTRDKTLETRLMSQ
jgi:protein TonB